MKDELIKILQNQDLLDDKTYKQQADEILNLLNVSITLPNKDATICEGYNKAKMQDYQNRNVLRHKDQDDYYSGWMECYDWISKGN
jgi:hypothetical protein